MNHRTKKVHFIVREIIFELDYKIKVSKCWPFVSEGVGSIDALPYKLGVSDFKCKD